MSNPVLHRRNIGPWDILGCVPGIASFASETWPNVNEAHFQWFRIPGTCVVKQLWVANGATASGNIDIGIYTPDGTLLVSSGATAQSGTNTIQTFDVTDTVLARGYYYVAVSMSSTSGTLRRSNLSSQNAKFVGKAIMASAHPLPSSATLATDGTGRCYAIGITTETAV